jgi:hypothetical protein
LKARTCDRPLESTAACAMLTSALPRETTRLPCTFFDTKSVRVTRSSLLMPLTMARGVALTVPRSASYCQAKTASTVEA